MTYLRSLLSKDNFGLRKIAQDNTGDFDNEVIDTVLKNFYVDD